MSITTPSPMRELETLRERMDKFFSEMSIIPRTSADPGFLALDMQETDDTFVVTASLPGFKAEDLNVEINRGTLSIHGERKDEREETKGTWHLRERRMGSFHRTLTLPTSTSEDEANAKLEDGVLTVTIPKSERTPTRRIDVKTK